MSIRNLQAKIAKLDETIQLLQNRREELENELKEAFRKEAKWEAWVHLEGITFNNVARGSFGDMEDRVIDHIMQNYTSASWIQYDEGIAKVVFEHEDGDIVYAFLKVVESEGEDGN